MSKTGELVLRNATCSATQTFPKRAKVLSSAFPCWEIATYTILGVVTVGTNAMLGRAAGASQWPAQNMVTLPMTVAAAVAAIFIRSRWMRTPALATRYHGVADEGVPFPEVAEVVGRHLRVPVVSKTTEEAADHFGWFANFAGIDSPASSAQTRAELG